MGNATDLRIKHGMASGGQILNAEIMIALYEPIHSLHMSKEEEDKLRQEAQAKNIFDPIQFPMDMKKWEEEMKDRLKDGDMVWLTVKIEDGWCDLQLAAEVSKRLETGEEISVPAEEKFSIAFDLDHLAKLKRAIDFMYTELMHEAAEHTPEHEPRRGEPPLAIAVIHGEEPPRSPNIGRA